MGSSFSFTPVLPVAPPAVIWAPPNSACCLLPTGFLRPEGPYSRPCYWWLILPENLVACRDVSLPWDLPLLPPSRGHPLRSEPPSLWFKSSPPHTPQGASVCGSGQFPVWRPLNRSWRNGPNLGQVGLKLV